MGASDPPPFVTRAAQPDDAALLAQLGATTFAETFESANTPEDFAAYMAAAFGEEIQRAELEDPDTTVFFAERGGEAVGYVMLREGRAPSSVAADDTLQIARLYARRLTLGSGVGAALMQCALAEAAGRGKDAVWLGVWERNARAIAFYQRWHFKTVGNHQFQLGSDNQTDLIMARPVPRSA